MPKCEKIVVSVACALSTAVCWAFTPLTDQAVSTTTKFSNGDVAHVSCAESHCTVEVTIFGKRFVFSGEETHLTILPSSVRLLPLDPTQLEFVAELEIVCPENVLNETPIAICSAGVRFQRGKIVEIEKLKKISHASRI